MEFFHNIKNIEVKYRDKYLKTVAKLLTYVVKLCNLGITQSQILNQFIGMKPLNFIAIKAPIYVNPLLYLL